MPKIYLKFFHERMGGYQDDLSRHKRIGRWRSECGDLC